MATYWCRPLHPFLRIANAIDPDKCHMICEPGHSVTVNFLQRECRPCSLLSGVFPGGRSSSNVKREAAKVVNAKLTVERLID